MTKYCDCGFELVHKKGTREWECGDPLCTVWHKEYARDGTLVNTLRVAVPRENPLPYDIIGEIS